MLGRRVEERFVWLRLLAAVGIYGVVSCAVTSRTREMGIRMALVAERRDVLSMVLRQATVLAGAGLAAGLAASFALTRFLSTLLFEVRTTVGEATTQGFCLRGKGAGRGPFAYFHGTAFPRINRSRAIHRSTSGLRVIQPEPFI